MKKLDKCTDLYGVEFIIDYFMVNMAGKRYNKYDTLIEAIKACSSTNELVYIQVISTEGHVYEIPVIKVSCWQREFHNTLIRLGSNEEFKYRFKDCTNPYIIKESDVFESLEDVLSEMGGEFLSYHNWKYSRTYNGDEGHYILQVLEKGTLGDILNGNKFTVSENHYFYT